MNDPYQVLGISPNATDEEVKKAYRRLVKAYHPDINPGPQSEQKMQEINAAYQKVQELRKGGSGGYSAAGGSTGYSYGPGSYEDPFQGQDPFVFWNFGNFGNFGGQQETHQDFTDIKLRAAANYINNGRWEEALRVLSDMTDRDGQWYYLSALANAGVGNRVTAMNHAQEAVRQEPDNGVYRSLLMQFQRGNFAYRQQRQDYGFQSMDLNRSLCTTCALCLLCNSCGSGFYFIPC